MSESLEGRSVAATRQEAGSCPAVTTCAAVMVACGRDSLVSSSHDAARAGNPVARIRMSVAALKALLSLQYALPRIEHNLRRRLAHGHAEGHWLVRALHPVYLFPLRELNLDRDPHAEVVGHVRLRQCARHAQGRRF